MNALAVARPGRHRRPVTLLGLMLVMAMVLATPAAGQKPVNGNGSIIKQVRPLSSFSSVSIDFPADVTIVNGETPSFNIEADQNILPHIGTRIRGGKLLITQDRWIEPSQKVRIRVGAPFTSELETSGYSVVRVEGITGSRFRVDAGVGTVTLEGSADRVQIRTKTGNVDAAALQSKYADVKISSHGKVTVGKLDELVSDVADKGLLIYDGQPQLMNKSSATSVVNVVPSASYNEPVSEPVEYVAFKLFNNSRRRVSLRVEGPSNRNFGYGFNLLPRLSRGENWPVGTRLYQEGRLKSDKLLLTVTPEMAGRQVNLFGEN